MTSRDRLIHTVNLEKADRVPVIPQVLGHAATVNNVSLKKYLQNGEVLARCQYKSLKKYDHDAVFALMDVNVESEAIGSKLYYHENQYPYIKSYALSKKSKPGELIIPDPHTDGRMPELLKAASLLRKEVGDDVMVIGCVMGPLTLTTQLMGSEEALFLAIDNSEHFSRILDYSTDVLIRFGLAQIESGAHFPIVFDPSSSPAVIPRQFFREFIMPRLKKMFSAFKSAGADANWLHIAGPVEPILPFYSQMGVDIGNFDYCVKPSDARIAAPDCCLDGNIKSLSFINNTPEQIYEESSRLLNHFSSDYGFILSSGCEIPPEANPETIISMVDSTRRNIN